MRGSWARFRQWERRAFLNGSIRLRSGRPSVKASNGSPLSLRAFSGNVRVVELA